MVASLLGNAAHLSSCFPLSGIEERDMTFTQRTRGIVQAIAVVLSLALPWRLAISPADAPVRGGLGSGCGGRAGGRGVGAGGGALNSLRTGSGFGLGSGSAALEIQPADYEAFERLLGEVQMAWSNEDVAKLHTLATPEMVSYFSKDLEENKANNDVNKVTDVKLLQGDLAEAWREGETDFASVAMRFSLVDKTLERGTNRLVAGSGTPVEVTEVS